MKILAGWENFYVIVGSSAGALIGLQFVVITLIASRPMVLGQALAGDAYPTPSFIATWVAALGDAKRAVAWDRGCRSILRRTRSQRSRLRNHRDLAYANTNHIPAPV
jgi:hypothetical protein